MAIICPTITAAEPHGYRTQLERLEPFAKRLHIDVSDGEFAPRKLIDIDKLWWPAGVQADVHVMYKRPMTQLPTLLALKPHLVILQAEAEGVFVSFVEQLHARGIKVGLALLPQTEIATIAPVLHQVQHVLIFSGNLGYQGGSTADLSLLAKARQLRTLKPHLEIGWDGGVNDQNAAALAAGGVDVLNVGGFIQNADDAATAYAKLRATI